MAARRMVGNQEVYFDEQQPPEDGADGTTGQGINERGPAFEGGPTPNDSVEVAPEPVVNAPAPAHTDQPANVQAMSQALGGQQPAAAAPAQASAYGAEYDAAHANDAANFFNSEAGRAVAPPGMAQPQGAVAAPTAQVPMTATPATPTPAGAVGSLGLTRLTELLNRPTTIDENDPSVAKALQGNRLALQRSEERQRAQTAESNSFNGQSFSGAADARNAGLAQARGESEATFAGNLIQQAQRDREAQLQTAIGQAMQAGDNEAARALSMQLAKMQDETSRLGIKTGADTSRYGIDVGAATQRAGLGENARQFDLSLADQQAARARSEELQRAGMSAASANAQADREFRLNRATRADFENDRDAATHRNEFDATYNLQYLAQLLGQTG